LENRNISRRKGIKTTHFHPSHIACLPAGKFKGRAGKRLRIRGKGDGG